MRALVLLASGLLCFLIGALAPATLFHTGRIERPADRAAAVRLARRLTLATGALLMLFGLFLHLGAR